MACHGCATRRHKGRRDRTVRFSGLSSNGYCCPIPQGCQKRRGDDTLSRCDDAIGLLYMAGTASIAIVREWVYQDYTDEQGRLRWPTAPNLPPAGRRMDSP